MFALVAISYCSPVAPHTGAWIEIVVISFGSRSVSSPPTRGAWIEITLDEAAKEGYMVAPPHGGRGLKYLWA